MKKQNTDPRGEIEHFKAEIRRLQNELEKAHFEMRMRNQEIQALKDVRAELISEKEKLLSSLRESNEEIRLLIGWVRAKKNLMEAYRSDMQAALAENVDQVAHKTNLQQKLQTMRSRFKLQLTKHCCIA